MRRMRRDTTSRYGPGALAEMEAALREDRGMAEDAVTWVLGMGKGYVYALPPLARQKLLHTSGLDMCVGRWVPRLGSG